MKRFVDLRHASTGYAFAFFCTLNDTFERHENVQAWNTFEDFAEDFDGSDGELDRFRALCPPWAF